MTDDEKRALEAEIRTFVGKPIGPPVTGRDPVNEPMIRQWCDAMGETHPAYLDADAAKKTVHGEIVAPPTMLQAWIMDGWEMHEGYDEPKNEQQRLHDLLAKNGYTGVLGTNTEENYKRYVRIGERITAQTIIDEISEEKATGVGIGYFITTRTDFENQDGEDLGSMMFRVLRFKPAAQQTASPAGGAAVNATGNALAQKPSRIKPPMGHDNGWWWEAVDRGELMIQKCSGCGTLRHPPRPMCHQCRSLEWEQQASRGTGSVHSHVVMHHPPIPGYDFPVAIALVDLDEGTRIVANIVDCPFEEIQIGMKVEASIEELGGLKIPVFRKVG